ncbi:MAG: efflux RND transporter periplasmic adaptor subunit [Ginsengibacter sp.]
MKTHLSTLLFCLFTVLLLSCKEKSVTTQDVAPEIRTPVTVTSVSISSLEDYIELNATSAFLQQTFVKSNLNGYIQKATIQFGDMVRKGQVLFVLKTKEARAIGNAVNQLDSSFKFSGINIVRADASGYIAQVNFREGDYVQDGEQLATISDSKSFRFLMNVPYEYMQYVPPGKSVQLILPDGEKLEASVGSSLPMVDSLSQTQPVALQVISSKQFPVNLVAKVRLIKQFKTAAQILNKNAVLTDETLNTFWVMKLINDSTAVKVPVKAGLETGDNVEILSPQFSPNDKILLTGNYGLGDTALVLVRQK